MTVSEAPHVALIILHWGPVEVTAHCLHSLVAMSFPGRTTIFLIDSTGRLDPAFATSLAPLAIEVYRPRDNLGFAKGCAWGIALALERGVDFILLLNNDVAVESSFLDALLRAARQSPRAGVWCPQIVAMTDPRKIWYAGGAFSLWSGIPMQEARSPTGAPCVASRGKSITRRAVPCSSIRPSSAPSDRSTRTSSCTVRTSIFRSGRGGPASRSSSCRPRWFVTRPCPSGCGNRRASTTAPAISSA